VSSGFLVGGVARGRVRRRDNHLDLGMAAEEDCSLHNPAVTLIRGRPVPFAA
jgi:hypothetical protein